MTPSPSRISVVMPLFNNERTVAAAVQSILNQTYPHFELIIVDDGSTDRSREIVEGFKDGRIVLLKSSGNHGIVAALNLGLDSVRGNFVARMDGDDLSAPTRFAKQLGFFLENPKVGVCGTAYRRFDNDGPGAIVQHPEKHSEIMLDFLLGRSVIAHPSVMLRSEFIVRGRRYSPEYQFCEDYEFWYQLALDGAQFANLPDVLIDYRISSSSISLTKSALQNALNQRVAAKFLFLPVETARKLIEISCDPLAANLLTKIYAPRSYRSVLWQKIWKLDSVSRWSKLAIISKLIWSKFIKSDS